MHNGEWLHQLDYWGKGKVIAVLDGGFLNVDKIYAYERAWGNNQILGQKDFTGDADAFFLKNRHGSQVFSLMAAYDYGRFVGAAPEASYWLIKTEVPEYEAPIEMDNLVAGIEFADSVGADILTASLGYCVFGDDSLTIDKSKMNGKFYRASIAESLAAKKGMVVVNSVGNKGNFSWHKFTVPADAVGILSVGSVDASGNHCIFSGVGPTSDLRYAPDVCSLGQSVAVLDENGNPSVSSGTSLSTPIIAGLTACLWQALPDLSAKDIINLVKKNASKSLSPDFQLGYGIPDFYAAYIEGRSNINLSGKPLNIIVKYNPSSKEISFQKDSLLQLKSDLLLFNDSGENVWRKSTRYSAMKFHLAEIPAGRYSLFIKINGSVAYYQKLDMK